MKVYTSNFEEFQKSVKSYVKRHFNIYASIDCGERTITCINKSNNDVIFVIVNDGDKVLLNYKKLWEQSEETKEDISNKVDMVVLPILKKIIKYATTPFLKEGSKVYVLDESGQKKCSFCNGKALVRSYCLMITNDNKLTFNWTLVCPKCRKVYIKKAWLEKNKRRVPNYIYEDVTTKEQVIQEDNADFLVRTSTIKCKNKGHKITTIRATVNVIKNGIISEVNIPGYYCENCKKYFILEDDYKKLRSKGIVLCKIIEQKLLSSGFTKYGQLLNSESVLHSYGYNVNAQENLSTMERHTILEFLLKNKILSKSDIKSHLSYLINRSSDNIKLYDAIAKWKSDIQFIDNYNISSESVLKINSLKIKIYLNK